MKDEECHLAFIATEICSERTKKSKESRQLSGLDKVLIVKACNFVGQRDLCYVMTEDKPYSKRLALYFSLVEYRKIAPISHKLHCFSS